MSVADRFYLDASALVKLVVEEAHSTALFAAVTTWELTSSVVASVEVRLVARRSGVVGAEEKADELLEVVAPILLTDEVARHAGRLERLRALDAIHLASALSVESGIAGFVAYDRRLAAAAADAGLRVISPT